MNNTINTYKNAPMFCAKPNAKQARRVIVEGPVKTIIRGDKKTVITQNNDPDKKIYSKTVEQYINDIKISSKKYEETSNFKYGTYQMIKFNPDGTRESGFSAVYRVDRRPWYKRLFSRNK